MPENIRPEPARSPKKSPVVLLRTRTRRNRRHQPGLKRISALWLSSWINIAAGVIGTGFGSVRRNAVKLLAVSTLCPGDSIELGQARVVAKQRLQVRRLSCSQLHLSVQ